MKKEKELGRVSLFNGQKIRRTIFNDEWWFSVVDICRVLAESTSIDQGAYWRKLKQRLLTENNESVTKCHDLKDDNENCQSFPFWEQLKLESSDGKKYETDCANTEGIFRIIQ